jgi:hypothetical protein
MPKATAPLDLLIKLRGYFAKEAEDFRGTERIAGSVFEKRAAAQFAETAEKFVSDIDATMRDWA